MNLPTPEHAEQRIPAQALRDMARRTRRNLINSVTGFKSANLIGTVDGDGQPNLALFSSAVHIGANPPLIGIVVRPHVVARHTYENLRATGCFTLNHVHRGIYGQAHQSAAKYDKGISEFEKTGLTPVFGTVHAAPYVAESRIRIGLNLAEELPIRSNGTILVVGEVVELFLPDGVLGEDGFVDLEAAGTVAISGLDAYHTTRRLDRLPYPRPE
jgi:flavin reductase (DIM6/NTAB) family NADH-FMN oxidoreductase RutF